MKKVMLVSMALAGLAQWGCSNARPIGMATGDQRPMLVGPAGPDGPAGPMGMQGPVGAMGAPGAVVVGPAGAAGPAGPPGMQGIAGDAGAQGSSVVGPMGPIGRAGPAGPQGIVGDIGAQGRTLIGPAGPAGRAGSAGPQGTVGQIGAQGSIMAGVAGPAGRTGSAGPQGAVGSIGARGPVGVIDRWTSFRDFWFDFNRADLQTSEMIKVSETAAYMKQNPSLRVGIDGSMDPRGADPRNQDLSDRRVSALRDALIQAGVPATKIQTGAFGDAQLTRDRRVGVLIRTNN